jgi:exopolyphosphatase/guanosine-5'-triphosphate,3'-diphosphate pyrophosphatase
MKVTKLGAIDIGSNSVRCLIVNVVYKDGYTHYKKVSMIRLPIRLGQDVFKYGKIRKVTRDRFVQGMKAFEHLLAVHGVEDYRAVATSAMREAKNSRHITQRVLRKTGIEIETISGEEEARLVFSSKLFDTIKAKENYFVYIDVGGGSTEISVIENQRVLTSKSFKIGGVRLMNDLVEPHHWEQMQLWIETNTSGLKNKAAIGAGGNINKLHKLSLKPVTEPLTDAFIADNRKRIVQMNVEDIITELGLNFDRADIITYGLEIYLKAMQWSGCHSIYVPKIGVSDGLIRDLYHREFRATTEGL